MRRSLLSIIFGSSRPRNRILKTAPAAGYANSLTPNEQRFASMPVDVTCSSCQRKMRVPDTAAGKRIKCPKCQGVIDVPGTSTSSVQMGVAVEMWHLKTDDGQIY